MTDYLKIWLLMGIIPLYWTPLVQAQQLPRVDSREKPVSSPSIQAWERQLQQQFQERYPVFYLFLQELEHYQPPDLQQQAEIEILELLERPKPLQQKLIEEQGL